MGVPNTFRHLDLTWKPMLKVSVPFTWCKKGLFRLACTLPLALGLCPDTLTPAGTLRLYYNVGMQSWLCGDYFSSYPPKKEINALDTFLFFWWWGGGRGHVVGNKKRLHRQSSHPVQQCNAFVHVWLHILVWTLQQQVPIPPTPYPLQWTSPWPEYLCYRASSKVTEKQFFDLVVFSIPPSLDHAEKHVKVPAALGQDEKRFLDLVYPLLWNLDLTWKHVLKVPVLLTRDWSRFLDLRWPLHWLPIDSWRQYKLTSLCYNCLSLTAHGCLTELLNVYKPAHQLRSSSGTCIVCFPSVQMH